MQPLQTNRQVLTWLCICPFEQNTSIVKKTFFAILTLFQLLCVISFVLSSIVIFVNNVSVNLEECLYAIVQMAGHGGLAYTWKKMSDIFKDLDAIYMKSK